MSTDRPTTRQLIQQEIEKRSAEIMAEMQRRHANPTPTEALVRGHLAEVKKAIMASLRNGDEHGLMGLTLDLVRSKEVN